MWVKLPLNNIVSSQYYKLSSFRASCSKAKIVKGEHNVRYVSAYKFMGRGYGG